MMTSASKKELKILGIDSNPDANVLLNTILTFYGHQYSGATDGKDGLELAKQKLYDIILLDLTIKDMGYGILDALRQDGCLEKQKVVILTASPLGKDELDELIKKGARAYIVKPVDIDSLMQKIEEIAGAS